MFTQVTVTRDYDLATGRAPSGTVLFTPSAWLVNGVTVPAVAVVAKLDLVGQIRIDLFANTDPATAPADSYYEVTEDIDGQPVRSYRVTVPHDRGALLDLGFLEAGIGSAIVAPPAGAAEGTGAAHQPGISIPTGLIAAAAGRAAATGAAHPATASIGRGYGSGGYGVSGYGV